MKRYISNTKILIGIFSILYTISIICSEDLGFNAFLFKILLYILGLCGLFLITLGVIEVRGIKKVT